MNRYKLLSIFALILGVFCVASQASPVSASDEQDTPTLRISPAKEVLALDPGDTYTGTYTISNVSTEDITFSLVSSPYSVSGDAYNPDYSTRDTYTQIADWVELAAAKYTLAPGEFTDVTYTIKVPLDVPAGSQHAAFFADIQSDDLPEGATGVQAISGVGMVLLAQVNGETRREGTYHDQRVTQFVGFGSFRAQTSFENTGNVDYTVTSTLTIRNFITGNYEYDNSELPAQSVVFPGKSRTIELTWPEQPLLGIYNVTYNVNFLDEDHTLERVVIFCPIWVILLFAGLIAFLIIYAILDHRKRRRY